MEHTHHLHCCDLLLTTQCSERHKAGFGLVVSAPESKQSLYCGGKPTKSSCYSRVLHALVQMKSSKYQRAAKSPDPNAFSSLCQLPTWCAPFIMLGQASARICFEQKFTEPKSLCHQRLGLILAAYHGEHFNIKTQPASTNRLPSPSPFCTNAVAFTWNQPVQRSTGWPSPTARTPLDCTNAVPWGMLQSRITL